MKANNIKGRLYIPGRPKSRIEHEQLLALSALAETAPPGDFVEVGVYRGGSAWYLNEIAERQGRRLHLFDTFTGIPNKGPMDERKAGDYADTSLPDLREQFPRAKFYEGIFPDTLPPGLIDDVAFVHVDCDQYDGHCACIDLLFPYMVPGGIMLFDDYPFLTGAKQAVDESFPPERLISNGHRHYVVKEI